jgi:hypothetical protein
VTKEDKDRPGYDEAIDRLVDALEAPELDQTQVAYLRRTVLGAKKDRSAEHRSRLLEALERFETDHPRFTKLINDVAYYLSGSGI